TFQVRSVGASNNDSAPSEWDWTIDTQAPVVTIDSAPSGTGNPPSATIRFHGSKPNLAFTCSLDGGPAQPCSSPDTIGGLADGPHTLSISAQDALGNTSAQPAVASWTVGGGTTTPPPSSCAAPAVASAS